MRIDLSKLAPFRGMTSQLGTFWGIRIYGNMAYMSVRYTDDERREIGAFLKEMRNRAGMSQTEVAQSMSTSNESYHQTQIAKIERGERTISLVEAIGYMDAVQAPVSDLIDIFGDTSVSFLKQESKKVQQTFIDIEELEKKIEFSNELNVHFLNVLERNNSHSKELSLKAAITLAESIMTINRLLRSAAAITERCAIFLKSTSDHNGLYLETDLKILNETLNSWGKIDPPLHTENSQDNA